MSKQRDRGRILTEAGKEKIKQAIRAWEFEHERRCTQEQLKELTGLDPSTLSKILNAKGGANPSKINALFWAFGLQLEETDLRLANSPPPLKPNSTFVGRNDAILDRALPTFLWQLFERLRCRGFTIGSQEYEALRQALWAGFGWSSREALRDLCSALWAKSRREQEILSALFEQLAPEPSDWQYSLESLDNLSKADGDFLSSEVDAAGEKPPIASSPKTESRGGLPPILLTDVKISERPFVFEPQFPLTYREVAQAWRRLRRPVRSGPAVELDIEGTIARRSQLGVATSVILRPRRWNVARLLLLVDRQGSMAPFHRFCDEVCMAIQQAGRLEETTLYYFHNAPAEGADEQVLESLTGQLFPTLDPILPKIQPLLEGNLYSDPNLLSPVPVADVLEAHAIEASVVIISDAGAARNRYRISRLLDTIAFMKALRSYTLHYVWLNPLPRRYWRNSTATQISHHVPMFSLDQEGIQRSVNVLRGQQHIIEKSI